MSNSSTDDGFAVIRCGRCGKIIGEGKNLTGTIRIKCSHAARNGGRCNYVNVLNYRQVENKQRYCMTQAMMPW